THPSPTELGNGKLTMCDLSHECIVPRKRPGTESEFCRGGARVGRFPYGHHRGFCVAHDIAPPSRDGSLLTHPVPPARGATLPPSAPSRCAGMVKSGPT